MTVIMILRIQKVQILVRLNSNPNEALMLPFAIHLSFSQSTGYIQGNTMLVICYFVIRIVIPFSRSMF